MTVVFPQPNSKLLDPYVEPFGRMMLGYGRAMVALREVAKAVLKDEEEAVKFMRKRDKIVDKVRDLCEPTFPPDRLKELLGYCETLAELIQRRNRIVHGEWWFNPFNGRGLLVRDWDREVGGFIHDDTVTPKSLDQLATRFSEVSSDLAYFNYMPNIRNAQPD